MCDSYDKLFQNIFWKQQAQSSSKMQFIATIGSIQSHKKIFTPWSDEKLYRILLTRKTNVSILKKKNYCQICDLKMVKLNAKRGVAQCNRTIIKIY